MLLYSNRTEINQLPTKYTRMHNVGGESDPKKTNGNGDVTVVTAAVDSVVIGNIDSKSALVNGDLKNDDLSKAVTRSTVSSTILNQLVIPNPNSILNQLTSSSSPSPSSPPTSSLNDQTATMNVSVNNNESRSQCNTAPIATSNSSDSVGSTGRRCIVIAQQRQSSISSQSSSQPTSPKDLCAANLPAQISSSNASSVSECTSIISKPQFIPKQSNFTLFCCINIFLRSYFPNPTFFLGAIAFASSWRR